MHSKGTFGPKLKYVQITIANLQKMGGEAGDWRCVPKKNMMSDTYRHMQICPVFLAPRQPAEVLVVQVSADPGRRKGERVREEDHHYYYDDYYYYTTTTTTIIITTTATATATATAAAATATATCATTTTTTTTTSLGVARIYL